MSAFIGDEGDRGEVNLLVSHQAPDIKKHASMALLYGLAVLLLDEQGVIMDQINSLLAGGPLSEVDAVNRISLLLRETLNDRPV